MIEVSVAGENPYLCINKSFTFKVFLTMSAFFADGVIYYMFIGPKTQGFTV
jgi:hypothetical protein